VKIYLRVNGGIHPEFYIHGDETDPDDAAPIHQGMRGRFERKLKHVKDSWDHPQNKFIRKTHQVWDWLQARMYSDETMLARLRHAATIEIVHPSEISTETARAVWNDYLARRQRRHWPWLVFNAALCPLTLLLAPLPGPNLIGYWFIYRAIHHALVIVGLRRVRHEGIATAFRPLTADETDDIGADREPVGSGCGEC
jgi:hypothetical protein